MRDHHSHREPGDGFEKRPGRERAGRAAAGQARR